MKVAFTWIARIILWSILLGIMLILIFGIPRFVQIFKELNVILPLLTRLVINWRYVILILLLMITIGFAYLDWKYSNITRIIILCGGIALIWIISVIILWLMYLPLFSISGNVK
jgi:hypothetical protein